MLELSWDTPSRFLVSAGTPVNIVTQQALLYCAAPETASISWSSGRPELAECSPQQLLEDMRLFLQV